MLVPIDNSSYLQHYGIKGMKWGVRRYRKEDGSLTEAGKKRYKDDISTASGKLKQEKKAAKEAIKNRQFEKAKQHTSNAKYYEREIADFKTRYKLEKKNKKSKRQLELEEKYQKEDKLTKEEAEVAAANKVRTERLIKTAAAVGVAAAVGYVAYRHYDNTVDRVVKGPLQNLTVGDLDINKPFYASHNALDNLKYQGAYGSTLYERGNVIKNLVNTGEGLKVASRKTATNYTKNLLNTNKEFRSNAKKMLKEAGVMVDYAQAQQAVNEINSGKLSPKSYDLMNRLFTQGITEISPSAGKVRDQLFDTLKKEGYGAVKDMNDARYSGYGSIDPLIVFAGNAKNVLEKPVSEALNRETVQKKAIPAYVSIYGPQLVPMGTAVAGSYALPVKLSKAAAKRKEKKAETAFIRKYSEEHPESKLSKNEILKLRDSK